MDTSPAVTAHGLARSFGRGSAAVTAVVDVDLHVPAGSVLGLLGPNGAGKTTVVRMLTGLLAPDRGEAQVAGVRIGPRGPEDPTALRRRIGLAGQYASVDELLTGRENLRMTARLGHLTRASGRARAEELLERFDLVDAADRRVGTYSGGMRRRLDLAASLVGDPALVVLDEPTTGLDPRSRQALWDVVDDLVAGGTTVLLTTQYLEEADRLADRLAVIDRGRIITEGTAGALKATLGGTRLEVRLDGPGSAPAAAAALAVVGEVAATGSLVSVAVSDAAEAVPAVVRHLDAAGVAVLGIRAHEPTLDDVFLALTGSAARPDIAADTSPSGRRRSRRDTTDRSAA